MRYPEHDKERFFKYTSAETAVSILETATVRYSSPLLFNDPFDVQSSLHFDFDIQSFPDRALTHIQHLVLLDEKPNISVSSPWGATIEFLREKKSTHGFPPNDLWDAVHSSIGQLRDQMVQLQTGFRSGWDSYLPRMRVFSVAEEKDNLLMWSHYGAFHAGAVFEFLVLPQEDNPLCMAKPVIYSKTPASLFTEQQWLEDILEIRKLNLEELYFRYAYIKSDAWVYEKEWRVWDLLPQRETTLYSHYPLSAKEIGAIYLGCNIAPNFKQSILSLVSQKYPEARVFQARKALGEFRLDFDSL